MNTDFYKFDFTIPGVEEHAMIAPLELGLAVIDHLVAERAPHKINATLNIAVANVLREAPSKIGGIKIIRAFSGCGLLEAKEIYEYMEQVTSSYHYFRF